MYAEWKKARVNLDYHIELDGHYYSTPYQLVGKEVEVRSTSGTVEIFYQGKRVASHVRSSQAHVASTNAGHRPKSHQQYLEWTPTRIIEWAGKVGPFTARLVEGILTSKPHPEMGYRSALGVIRLERKYGDGAAGSGLHAGGAFEAVSLSKREVDVGKRPGPSAVAGAGADAFSGGA